MQQIQTLFDFDKALKAFSANINISEADDKNKPRLIKMQQTLEDPSEVEHIFYILQQDTFAQCDLKGDSYIVKGINVRRKIGNYHVGLQVTWSEQFGYYTITVGAWDSDEQIVGYGLFLSIGSDFRTLDCAEGLIGSKKQCFKTVWGQPNDDGRTF
jgi:hypothetical protein